MKVFLLSFFSLRPSTHTLSLSVCLSLSLSLSLSLFLSLSLSLFLIFFHFTSFDLICLSIYLSVFSALPVCLSVCLSLTLSRLDPVFILFKMFLLLFVCLPCLSGSAVVQSIERATPDQVRSLLRTAVACLGWVCVSIIVTG